MRGVSMDNEINKSKIKTYLEKLTSEETSLKKIPFYLFLLGVLVCVLIFKINETNKYLKIIAENGNVVVENHTNDENYESVLNIYTEDAKRPEDILPNPKDDITDKNDTDEKTEPTNNLTPQQTEHTEEITENNSQDATYVINISSKKIHKPDCSFVSRTKEENKKTVTLSEDELKEYINNGHELCKTCGGK